MGINTQGRRKIRIDNRSYVWWVGPDADSPYLLLSVYSDDKRFSVCCPLQTPTPYVIDRGTLFQGVEKRNAPVVHTRYRLPFPVPEVVTPRFVATLLEWALNGRGAVRVEWDGNEVPV